MSRKSKSGGGIFHNPKSSAIEDRRSSASQSTSVGSGSRPTRSRIAIDESSPSIDLAERKPKSSRILT